MKISEYLKKHNLNHKKFVLTKTVISIVLGRHKNPSAALTKKIQEVKKGNVTFDTSCNPEVLSNLIRKKKKQIEKIKK